MHSKPTLFDQVDPRLEAEADQQAESDVRAGRLISQTAVRRWLASWSTGKPHPRPKVGE